MKAVLSRHLAVPADLVEADPDHLIHPLHHPVDRVDPLICVRGRGVMVQDIEGQEYPDGLPGLWNVNIAMAASN